MDRFRNVPRSVVAVGLAVTTAVSTLVSLVSCCVLLLLASVLHERVVGSDELPGAYRLDAWFSSACPVTLTLHDDGTDDEVVACEDGKTFENAGDWHVAVTRFRVYVALEDSIFATAINSNIDPPRPEQERFEASRDIGGGILLAAGDPDGVLVFEEIEQ